MYTPAGFEPGCSFPEIVGADAIVFAFRGGKLLVTATEADAAPRLPSSDDLAQLGVSGATHFLGTLQGRPCLAVNAEVAAGLSDAAAEPPPAPAGWCFSGLRGLFFRLPDALVAIGGRAFQIVEWDRTHRFCGACAHAMQDKPGERARECPRCGHIAYPRVSPAMMVLVTRGRQMLLARATRFPPGMFSALAGFVEAGETIEDCIRREVREEVGIDVAHPVYFGSQSWAFPHSLMIAFTAEYAGGELTPDATEIAEAAWFDPEAMPTLPQSLSIARHLIDSTAARLRSQT